MNARRGRGRRGFTLVELAIAIALLGIVAAMTVGVLVEGGRIYARSSHATDAFADAQHVLDRICTELANLASASDIGSIADHSITFTVGGEARTYAKSGSSVLRNSNVLAEDVTRFDLTYYKNDGTLATAPADVARIAIEIAITRQGTTARLRSEVALRALGSRYDSWSRGPESASSSSDVIDYVDGSREEEGDEVDFRIINTSANDVTFDRLTVTWSSPTAYFRHIEYTNAGESQVIPWRDHDDPEGRWGSGETRQFNQSGHETLTLYAGQTAWLEFEGFKSKRSGGHPVDMDDTEVTVTFYNGTTQVGQLTVGLPP